MHILILPAWYPTKTDEVQGSFFEEQATALARAGHTVTVFPYYRDAVGRCYVEKERKQPNLTQYSIHYRVLPLHLTYFSILLAMAGVLLRELRRDRPDLIHVHSFRAAKYAIGLKRIFRLPYVITEHASWFERRKLSEKELRAARKAFRHAEAVCAVSEGLKKTIAPLCDKEITVIPNMVSERFFRGGLHREAGERFGFISVGNLEYNKGQDVLLNAFGRVARQEPNVTLTVCGWGPYRETILEKAKEWGVADRVVLTGRVPRDEIVRRLQENQVFVLPSRTETFGVVFIEAMACGLPIIMTKTGAWELLVRPETGIAVDIDDEDALAAAMLEVMHCYRDYDPRVISESCRSRFSEKCVCAMLEEVYRMAKKERQKP